MKRLIVLVVGLAFVTMMAAVAFAAQPFYEGKTIRIIVAAPPGGGFDTYARLISRHMTKHIPGHPTFIVENMAGAGGLVAANYHYRVSKPDGLTIASLLGGFMLSGVFRQQGVDFDVRKFAYIGAPAKDTPACLISKATGITALSKWKEAKIPPKLGGVAPGSHAPDNVTRMIKSVLGFPLQLVTGYKGTAEIRLAFESGEVTGCCLGWESARTTWRKAVEAGDVTVLLQTGPEPMADLPDVPLAINLAKTDEERQLIRAGIHYPALTARSYCLPPGTPKDRVQILRQAFQETLRDRDLLVEAENAKIGINPVTGEELDKVITEIFKLDPALLAKLKDVLLK